MKREWSPARKVAWLVEVEDDAELFVERAAAFIDVAVADDFIALCEWVVNRMVANGRSVFAAEQDVSAIVARWVGEPATLH